MRAGEMQFTVMPSAASSGGERSGEAGDTCLGGGDVRPVPDPGVRGNPANVDDAGSIAAPQERQRRLIAQEGAVQDAGDDPPPFLEGDRLKRRIGALGGIVDQGIQPAEAFGNLVEHALHRGRIGQVGERDHRVALAARSGAAQFRRLPRRIDRSSGVHHDLGPALRQRHRDGAADVARGAGHQRDVAGKLLLVGRLMVLLVIPAGVFRFVGVRQECSQRIRPFLHDPVAAAPQHGDGGIGHCRAHAGDALVEIGTNGRILRAPDRRHGGSETGQDVEHGAAA